MDKRSLMVLLFIFGGLFLVFFAFLALAVSSVRTPDTRISRAPQIGIVEINELIMDSKKTLEALESFRRDSRIRGIIVRIDSPGGAVAPSQEIYDAIIRVRDDKPVLASMASTATSGGYYIAVAADEIVANPGSVTGSIGVISQITNLEGLAEWARVDIETLKSGDLKDVGNAFRKMTDEEREYFMILLQDIHDQFISAVAQGRGTEVDEIKHLADGRIFTGRQAYNVGLVDHLGSFDYAVERMMELAELKSRPNLVYPRRDEFQAIRDLLGTAGKSLAGGIKEEFRTAGLSGQGPSFWFLPGSY